MGFSPVCPHHLMGETLGHPGFWGMCANGCLSGGVLPPCYIGHSLKASLRLVPQTGSSPGQRSLYPIRVLPWRRGNCRKTPDRTGKAFAYCTHRFGSSLLPAPWGGLPILFKTVQSSNFRFEWPTKVIPFILAPGSHYPTAQNSARWLRRERVPG